MATINKVNNAASAATNTSQSAVALTKQVSAAQQRKRELAKAYAEEEKVRVQGSPFYRPYFGNNMPLQINGISVYVPLDGKPHTIPRTFANLFQQRLDRIDNLIQKQGQLSAIVEESYAGEVNLLGTVE